MRQLTPHEEFYHVPTLYEIYIVNNQTYEKSFIGYCIDGEYLKKVIKEIDLFLKDYKDFFCMTRDFPANEHRDDYMERVEGFIKTSLHWDTTNDAAST